MTARCLVLLGSRANGIPIGIWPKGSSRSCSLSFVQVSLSKATASIETYPSYAVTWCAFRSVLNPWVLIL